MGWRTLMMKNYTHQLSKDVQFRPRPQYAEDKSPALFLQEGLFSALIQYENEAFQMEEFKNAGLAF